jgi:hypothetical protein
MTSRYYRRAVTIVNAEELGSAMTVTRRTVRREAGRPRPRTDAVRRAILRFRTILDPPAGRGQAEFARRRNAVEPQ